MCSMDGRVKALVIARECSRVRVKAGAFLSVLALLVKEALLLGLRRWIDVFQEESMVNCRLCADSVLGVHVHQLRQQAEKGVSRFDGGAAFAHHVVDDASLAERGARFNIRHYVRPFHRTVFVKEKGANVFFHAHDHVRRKTVTSECAFHHLEMFDVVVRLEQSLPRQQFDDQAADRPHIARIRPSQS